MSVTPGCQSLFTSPFFNIMKFYTNSKMSMYCSNLYYLVFHNNK